MNKDDELMALRTKVQRLERENHELSSGGRLMLHQAKQAGAHAGRMLRAAEQVIDAWDACLAYPDTSSERGDVSVAVEELREATRP